MNPTATWRTSSVIAAIIFGAVLVAVAQKHDESTEQERKVSEAEVPPAALAALKKLAGDAKITEFAEEIEHGHTYYEASFKGADGNVDALVTAAGDLVEIEEAVNEGAVPKPVLEKARAASGADAKLRFEKKTVVFYEVKFNKDGRWHEILFSPDGRQHEHEQEESTEGEDD